MILGGLNGIKGAAVNSGGVFVGRGVTSVVMGNSPALPVYVPYGQTFPRG